MSPSATNSGRPRSNWVHLRLAIGAALAVVGLLAVSTTPVSAEGGGVFEVEQFIRYNSVNATSHTVAAGTAFRYVINYTCTNADCENATLTVPFPDGYNIASPTYSTTDFVAYNRVGNVMTFQFAPSITAGSTGQIDVEASTTAFLTPDGTTFSQQATVTAPGLPDATSALTTVTVAADVQPALYLNKLAGGASDDVTVYQLVVCPQPSATAGPLGLEAGSSVTATLPAGAVVERSPGATASPGPPQTLSWTYPAINDNSCRVESFTVSYPAGADNGVGASKTVTAGWDFTKVGQAPASTTTDLTHVLTDRSVAFASSLALSTPYAYGSVPVQKADIGQTVGVSSTLANTGVGTLETARTDIAVSPELDVRGVGANNPGGQVGAVRLRTTCGPDRTDGTADDGEWEDAAVLPALGAAASFDPRAEWPNGNPAIPAGCFVTDVRAETPGVWPGDSGTVLGVLATVISPDRDGNPTVSDPDTGDVFQATRTVTVSNSAGTADQTDVREGRVAPAEPPPPPPTNTIVSVRNFGPGTLPNGVTEGTSGFAVGVLNNPLQNPTMVVLLKPGQSLVSWSGDPTGTTTPTPTLTQIPDYDGQGGTALVWDFPGDMPVSPLFGSSYYLTYTVAADEFAYGNLNMPGYVLSTATNDVGCADNYFGAQPDTYDFDGDSDLAEIGCRWDADFGLTASASASVVTRIKGSFDADFVAGPATGQTAPGSDDAYQLALKNTGRTELDQMVMVQKLPRPGDTRTISAGARNPSTRTFPVLLRAQPSVPTLPEAPTIEYSTLAGNVCQPELGYNPAGCVDPAWSPTPPADLADVTMIKVFFGDNVLKPGRSWTVTIPVTTPTSGATEPDRADFNPDPVNVANEKAVNTIAIKGQRKDISTALSSAEPPGVTLEIPGALGPVGPAPDPSPLTTTGVGTARHTTSVTPPPGGTVHLLDGTTPVSTLVVPGVGTYSVDPATGAMTFDPEPGHTGTAPAVDYRVTDGYGQTGESTWTTTVTVPDPPVAADLTSSGPVRTPQQVALVIPAGGSVRLLDGGVPTTSLDVPDVGTYSLNTATGVVTFTPATLFNGTAPAIDYRATDAYGQTDDGTYTPTVTLAPITATPLNLAGVGRQLLTGSVILAPLSESRLLDGTTPSNSLIVPGKGTFTIDAATGAVTFLPVLGFSGTVAVPYRLTDEFGQIAESTIVATVSKPPPPTAQALTSTSTPEQPFVPQSVTFTIPPDTTISLLDGAGDPVTSLTVPGQGTYVLDPVTGVVTFTPVDGYRGPVTPVPVRLLDAYGQSATGSYSPAIGTYAPTTLPPQTGEPSPRPSITIPIPPGGRVTLVGPDGADTNEVAVAGQGTYVLDPLTGVLTFIPVAGFEGSPPSVTYKVTDAEGRVSFGTFSPTVLGNATEQPGSGGATTGAGRAAPLAFTGSATATLTGLGALVLCLGMALTGVARRRRRPATVTVD